MKTDNLDVIQSYVEIGVGKFYMFYIDEDFESETDIILSPNEKLIKRTTYDGFETYEDAFNAYQAIHKIKLHKIMAQYTSIF